jgi:hypothetical protein
MWAVVAGRTAGEAGGRGFPFRSVVGDVVIVVVAGALRRHAWRRPGVVFGGCGRVGHAGGPLPLVPPRRRIRGRRGKSRVGLVPLHLRSRCPEKCGVLHPSRRADLRSGCEIRWVVGAVRPEGGDRTVGGTGPGAIGPPRRACCGKGGLRLYQRGLLEERRHRSRAVAICGRLCRQEKIGASRPSWRDSWRSPRDSWVCSQHDCLRCAIPHGP